MEGTTAQQTSYQLFDLCYGSAVTKAVIIANEANKAKIEQVLPTVTAKHYSALSQLYGFAPDKQAWKDVGAIT